MVRTTTLTLCLVLGLVAMACSKTENTNTNTSSSTTEKPATASTPATSTTSSSTASTSGDSIGVPECDDFIAKYDACVSSKVPEMVRAQYKDSLKQWKESWKKLAENPQTKSTLVSACKQAAEQQAAALKSFGCNF